MTALNARMPGGNGEGGDENSRPWGWGFRPTRQLIKHIKHNKREATIKRPFLFY